MTNNNKTANTYNDITTFNNVKDLCADMSANYQSFVRYENELNATGKKAIIESQSVYRLVQIKRGKLEFYGSKAFGGSELCINGKIERAEKIGAENDISEYRIYIEELDNPLVLMALKKREYMK